MSESIPSGFKKCTKCGHIKDFASFAKDKRSKDGLQYRCRDCMNEARNILHIKNRKAELQKAKEYNEQNKEKVSAYQKMHYEENSEIMQIKNKVNWLEKILFEPEFGYLNS